MIFLSWAFPHLPICKLWQAVFDDKLEKQLWKVEQEEGVSFECRMSKVEAL